MNYLSIFSADAKGFFKDEGLENETIVIGGPAGIAALISGDVDYSGAGGSGLRAAVKGAPLKAIMYQTERPTWYLIVHPSDFAGFRSQRKKNRRCVDSATARIDLRRCLSNAPACRQRTSRKSPLAPALPTRSLASRAAPSPRWCSIPPEPSRRKEKGLRNLAYLGDIFPLPFQGYVATDKKIAENSAQLKRWLRAVIRGLMFMRERPDEAADVAMKRLQFGNVTKPC